MYLKLIVSAVLFGSLCSASMLPLVAESTATPAAAPAQDGGNSSTIRVVPTPTALPSCLVSAEFLNVRSEPNAESTVIGSLKAGDVVSVTEVISKPNGMHSWFKIDYGYINSVFCK